jgi:hypothetical protein
MKAVLQKAQELQKAQGETRVTQELSNLLNSGSQDFEK